MIKRAVLGLEPFLLHASCGLPPKCLETKRHGVGAVEEGTKGRHHWKSTRPMLGIARASAAVTTDVYARTEVAATSIDIVEF